MLSQQFRQLLLTAEKNNNKKKKPKQTKGIYWVNFIYGLQMKQMIPSTAVLLSNLNGQCKVNYQTSVTKKKHI